MNRNKHAAAMRANYTTLVEAVTGCVGEYLKLINWRVAKLDAFASEERATTVRTYRADILGQLRFFAAHRSMIVKPTRAILAAECHLNELVETAHLQPWRFERWTAVPMRRAWIEMATSRSTGRT